MSSSSNPPPTERPAGASSRGSRRAPPGPALEAAVVWRNGIHIRGTPIWCDARRPRDVCFVSCAHIAGVPRHGQLIATAETLALLGPDAGGDARLPVLYGRPFTLGNVRLELLRSGHALGSASLLVHTSGHRILYAGAIDPRGGGLGGAAEPRPCDALVIDATYGHPRYVFPPLDRTIMAARAFLREVTSAGGAAVLLVSSPGKALDVAVHLSESQPARAGAAAAGAASAGAAPESHPGFLAHWSICEAARRLRATHRDLPRIRRWSGKLPGGQVLLWPADQREALGALPAPSRVALVSGRALDPEQVSALAVDAAFAWSNQADHGELLAYIEQSGARVVLATSRHAEDLAALVAGNGRVARALGPPRQMSLFSA